MAERAVGAIAMVVVEATDGTLPVQANFPFSAFCMIPAEGATASRMTEPFLLWAIGINFALNTLLGVKVAGWRNFFTVGISFATRGTLPVFTVLVVSTLLVIVALWDANIIFTNWFVPFAVGVSAALYTETLGLVTYSVWAVPVNRALVNAFSKLAKSLGAITIFMTFQTLSSWLVTLGAVTIIVRRAFGLAETVITDLTWLSTVLIGRAFRADREDRGTVPRRMETGAVFTPMA